MNRRRILYVDLAPTVGGSLVSLFQLVKGVDRSHFEPYVLLDGQNPYCARFRELGVPVLTLDHPNAAAPDPNQRTWSGLRRSGWATWLKRKTLGERFIHLLGFYLRIWPRLRRQAGEVKAIIRSLRPDLVHLNDVVSVSRVGILAARWARVPAICHLRAMDSRNHFDRWLSRSLRGYICISEAVDRHQRSLGGRTEPSWIVYNGLDLSEFERVPAATDVRAKLGLPPDAQVVGCVGRLVRWKGQHVFLRALAKLAFQYPHLRGLIVGAPEANGGAYEEEIKMLARELGVDSRVLWVGFRNDIPDLLQGMDILVHASIAPEPFGRVLIEGMAASKAVIGTAAGAVPEIIRHGMDGLLVSPDDVEEMAQAIGWLLDHPAQQRELGLAGRRRVAMFSVSQYIQGVERVYQEILRGRPE